MAFSAVSSVHPGRRHDANAPAAVSFERRSRSGSHWTPSGKSEARRRRRDRDAVPQESPERGDRLGDRRFADNQQFGLR